MVNVPKLRFTGFSDDWEQRKLKDVASSFEYGLNAAAKEFDGVNKYLRITDIDDASRVFKDDDLSSPDADLSSAGDYRLQNGDVLFARTGASVGKSFIYRESDGLVYFAGFLIRARIKPECNAEFIFQSTLTSQYEKYIQITSQRSGQPGVNAQEYGEYTFLMPDYSEQKRIATLLRQIDTLITLHQRKCDTLSKAKKYFLQNLFPQRGEKKPRLRFDGFTDDWEQRKLGDLLTFQNGFNGGRDSFGSGVPLISVMDILNNQFITYDSILGKATVSDDEFERYSVNYGDVLFQRSSENVEDAGSTNVYIDSKPAIFGGFVIRGKQKAPYSPKFMKYMLDSSAIRKQITAKAQGAQHINVSQEILQDIHILLPQIEEQVAIENFLFSFDCIIQDNQRRVKTLKTMKQFMLQNLFPRED